MFFDFFKNEDCPVSMMFKLLSYTGTSTAALSGIRGLRVPPYKHQPILQEAEGAGHAVVDKTAATAILNRLFLFSVFSIPDLRILILVVSKIILLGVFFSLLLARNNDSCLHSGGDGVEKRYFPNAIALSSTRGTQLVIIEAKKKGGGHCYPSLLGNGVREHMKRQRLPDILSLRRIGVLTLNSRFRNVQSGSDPSRYT
ncbi:hypothetical protein BP00DRAFT_93076 [Aspergillus indologenus CBS 114.80]|uniref:Uncharacterized protein n=1 Tax=Aspergillus indologenus CBS 114.80 TaxID=1450541 RepID=A0A2V5HMC8_9EURO|nr:hypothetical protein BP00DRAFT_93076 [Aspergillus indologenus CBS 114.80]